MATDVSIIYVNYHTSSLIRDSILSIGEKVKGISYEIIVVDNNSEKNLEEKLQDAIPYTVKTRYVYLEENIGFGGANNAGAEQAEGKYLFFLNPDTLLLNNAIKVLYDFMEVHPEAGACGGNLTESHQKPSYSFRKILPGVNWEFQELTHYIFSHPLNKVNNYYNFTDQPVKVAYISGADLMVRQKVFKETGGFDPTLFMYWDDVEICRRIDKAGYEIFNVPEAKICHLESQSFENEDLKENFKIELLEKYRIAYLKKNLSKVEYRAANLLYDLFLRSRELIHKGGYKAYYKLRKRYFEKYREEFS